MSRILKRKILEITRLDHETPWPPGRLAWQAVILLGIANLFSFVDRFMLSLVVGPIKQTFDISDTEVGMLQGLAFGVFYTLLGIPIGRIADKYNRRTIVGWAVALWSLMTALFGLARNYTELFLCRMGVGVGEAALNPCAVSLLSDYFPEEKRATALGVYTMSAFIGGGLAILLGGTLVSYLSSLGALVLPFVGEIEAWQLAFICVGTPGLAVGLLMMTIEEPKRRELFGSVPEGKSVPFSVMGKVLRDKRAAFSALIFGFALVGLDGYAKASWMPEFFVRTFGWSMAEIGLNYGLTYLVFAGAGALCGGWASDLLRRRGHMDAPFLAAAIGVAISLPFSVIGPLVNHEFVALAFIAVALFFSTFPYPLAATAVSQLAPNQMRAQVMAFYLLVVNLVGVGLGPTVTALLTDFVFGDESYLRFSLSIVSACTLPLAFLIFTLGRPAYKESIAVQKTN